MAADLPLLWAAGQEKHLTALSKIVSITNTNPIDTRSIGFSFERNRLVSRVICAFAAYDPVGDLFANALTAEERAVRLRRS